jgi:hypothetical protein
MKDGVERRVVAHAPRPCPERRLLAEFALAADQGLAHSQRFVFGENPFPYGKP